MSETEMIEEEQVPNPYNMKKPWHKDGQTKPTPRADELYYEQNEAVPNNQATRKTKSAPDTSNDTNYKKRYDDLKKHYDSKIATHKQQIEELKAQMQPEEVVYEAPKSDEELESFRDKYSDLADTVETIASKQVEARLNGVNEKLSALEQRELEIAHREAQTALQEKHPDFAEIRNSDDFHTWAEDQPVQIQDWIYNNPNNVGLAVKALDLYKLETGKGQNSKPKRSPVNTGNQISAADMVSTKTTNVEPKQAKIWTEDEIAKMSLDQFDKYEDEIKLAHAEGRIRKS